MTALVASGAVIAVHAATTKPDATLGALTYSGDQALLAELDREIYGAGKDPAKLAAVEQRLLTALRRGEPTFAARQALCQRLGIVLAQVETKRSADAYKPLGAMLADGRDSDLARLALEPAPGAVVDQLFVNALAKTHGRTRIGIADSLGRRRSGSAVAALAALLKDTDPLTVAAAANALGTIANSAALAALQQAPAVPAVLSARIAAAQQLPASESLPVLRALERDRTAPPHLRAAAFRTALELEPAKAVARIVETLGGDDRAARDVALEALGSVATTDLVPALTRALGSWDAPTQAAVIAALGRRGDAAAVPTILGALKHSDAEVRGAAIVALGGLPGNREVATALAQIAADSSHDHTKLARDSLARLNGPDVSATILAGAERGDPALRAAYLEQLALRNMTEGLPLLLKCRTEPDAAIRTAAVGALGDLAPFSEQRVLIEWAVAATDAAEQSRALRSLVNVTLRNPKTAERGRIVYEALEKASADVALRLLPALPRLGGTASAECAARLALRTDEKLAETAVSTLTRWTDGTALPSLANVAEKAELPASRAAALNGALRYFERNREPWTEEFTRVVARLLPATKDAAGREKLVGLLARARDERALALAESLQTDSAVADRARRAAAVIRANRAGPPALRASGNESNVKNAADGKTSTRWTVSTQGEEWLEVDFKVSRPIERVTLDQTGRAPDFPERYELYVTDSLDQLGTAKASGKGERTKTVVELPAGTAGRYMVIKNTAERADGLWSVCELFVD